MVLFQKNIVYKIIKLSFSSIFLPFDIRNSTKSRLGVLNAAINAVVPKIYIYKIIL
jgi:hypothetical protein